MIVSEPENLGRFDADLKRPAADLSMLRTNTNRHRCAVRQPGVPAGQRDNDAAVQRETERTIPPVYPALDEVHLRRAEETGDEPVGRAGIELDGRSSLLDDAFAQHHDLVGHSHGLDLVVRDIDHGRAEPAVQRNQFAAHLDPQLGVEVGKGLVEQESLGLLDDGPADGDALALPARELNSACAS